MNASEAKDEASARDRILDAALAEFGANGFNGATTRAIAKRAGVNEVTIFRLFGSKFQLFQAVLDERWLLAGLMERLSFDAQAGLDEALYRNMRYVLGMLRQNKHMFLMLLGDAPRMPELRGMMRDLVVRRAPDLVVPIFRGLMEQGELREVDPEAAVRGMMGMVQSYFIMEDLLGTGEVDEERDERMLRGFVSVFLDGVRGRADGRA